MERVVALLGVMRLMVRRGVAVGRSFHDIVFQKHRESGSCVAYLTYSASLAGFRFFFRHGVSKIYT